MIDKLKNYSLAEKEINYKIRSILRAKIDNEIDDIINQQLPNQILTEKDKDSIKQILHLLF